MVIYGLGFGHVVFEGCVDKQQEVKDKNEYSI
jgi:hypothetical protein